MSARSNSQHRCNQSQSVPRVISADYDNWFGVLKNKPRLADDALSITDWSKKINRSRDATAKWLSTGIDKGWVERAPIVIRELTGRTRTGIGFRLKEKTK